MSFDERISGLVAQQKQAIEERNEKQNESRQRFNALVSSTIGSVFDETTNHHDIVLHSVGLEQLVDDDKGITTSVSLTANGGQKVLAYHADLDHGAVRRTVTSDRRTVCERPLTFDSVDRARVEADVLAFLRFALGLSTDQDIQAELGVPSRAS